MENPIECVRCGYCCHSLMVMIVSDPELGLVEDNIEVHDGNGPCKHLRGSVPGEFSCAVHGKSWYPQTPCFDYTQVGGGKCRMGEAILSGKLKANFLRQE